MNVNEFLEIYKHPMSKLMFKKVKFVRSEKTFTGRLYYHFIGLFEFVLPPTFSLVDNFNENKDELLSEIKKIDDDFSLVYRKKFTRKVKSNDKNKKWKFEYMFDFNPKNIVDYEIDENDNKMKLQVIGYGIF